MANSRTQFFFGNRLEDILRLDVPFGLGVRQELPDSSIMAFSILFTPAELKFWADPFIENEERERTALNFRGIRWRWGGILRTGLELTATFRWFEFDLEKSGDWLVDEGRLTRNEQNLLIRNGNVARLQVLYRIQLKKHRFEPTFRLIYDNHQGEAIANRGFTGKLTYLYLSPRFILDVNLGFGQRVARAINPIYNEKADAERYGGAVTIFVPFKKMESSIWSLWASFETFNEDSRIDFFDSRFSSIMGGVVWRHLKK